MPNDFDEYYAHTNRLSKRTNRGAAHVPFNCAAALRAFRMALLLLILSGRSINAAFYQKFFNCA